VKDDPVYLLHIRGALDDITTYHDQMCQCIQPE